MPDRDTPVRLADLAEAIALLTRLPVRLPDQTRGAGAAWAYPLAGLAVGLLAAGVAWLAAALGLPPAITAGLALATGTIVTGALHEDGLADSADGLWGGWTPEHRLKIMKDSHIGSFGVLALVGAAGLRWAALTAIVAQGSPAAALIAAAIVSRAPMVALMHALPNARGSGLSDRVGRPDRPTALVAGAIALAAALLLTGTTTLAIAITLTLTTVAIHQIARRKIGGQTGDILGATQQISEIAVLAVLAA